MVVLSVKESLNGEFVIAVGAKHADSSGKTSRNMFKIDASNGDIIWSKMMPNTESDIAKCEKTFETLKNDENRSKMMKTTQKAQK